MNNPLFEGSDSEEEEEDEQEQQEDTQDTTNATTSQSKGVTFVTKRCKYRSSKESKLTCSIKEGIKEERIRRIRLNIRFYSSN